MRRERLANVEIEVAPGTAELPGEELLVDVLRRILGSGWDIESWVVAPPRVDGDGRYFYRLAFVFVPDTRTREARRVDAEEATRG